MFSTKPFDSASLKDSTQIRIYIIYPGVLGSIRLWGDDLGCIYWSSNEKFHKEHFHLLNFPVLPEMCQELLASCHFQSHLICSCHPEGSNSAGLCPLKNPLWNPHISWPKLETWPFQNKTINFDVSVMSLRLQKEINILWKCLSESLIRQIPEKETMFLCRPTS